MLYFLKRALVGLTLFVAVAAFADPHLASKADFYYGEEITQLGRSPLKSHLHHVLKSYHISNTQTFDKIVRNCDIGSNDNCYTHKHYSYKMARRYLFGYLHLKGDSPTSYNIESVYCGDSITNEQLPNKQSLGPMQIPSANVINAEHAWPQSHFTNNFPKHYQKSDLHSLYPVRMRVNSTRGNFPFGKVESIVNLACDEAALGKDKNGQRVFEPSDEVKGNIARSLFYFATRYNTKIDSQQESVLRQWHKLDPVDEEEALRNQEIYEIQHNRNPYIDHPEWVDKVNDF